ncbi:MAG TPA: glycosyltransferase family 9 protein [Candidatus Krumholzibacterium sp.]|nr:glycosyltransferase family 9 protein [Candidatus Krumholzibacterium sp.]
MLKKIEKGGKFFLARFLGVFLRTRKLDPGDLRGERVERLLVIRQHNQMGDMLCAVPALRGLKERFPGARVSLVAAPINTDVMRGNPYVDEVLTYSKERQRENPLALILFIRLLRRRRFDAVIVLNTVSFSVTSMLLALASGARLRMGSTSTPFGSDITSRYYHIELPLPSSEELAAMHETRHNLYPLSVIGVRSEDLRSVVVPDAEEEERLKALRSDIDPEGRGYIVVHPGAGKKQNIWPPERFARSAVLIAERHGLAVTAVRGPVDGEALELFLSEFSAAAARTGIAPPVTVSSPSVGLFAALMRDAAVTLCNDTGVMHIAGAAGARCVAVFGPTEPERWKPVNEEVVAVRAPDRRMDSVDVGQVVDAAERLISGG